MLTIGGGEAPLIRFCRAIKPPNTVAVLAQDASTTFAPGADAPAHSASSAASPSSPLTPELLQVAPPVASFCENDPPDSPKAVRNVVTSDTFFRSVSSITTMV